MSGRPFTMIIQFEKSGMEISPPRSLGSTTRPTEYYRFHLLLPIVIAHLTILPGNRRRCLPFDID